MGCCSQTIFLLWPKIAVVGVILWSPAPQPNDDDDDDQVMNEEVTHSDQNSMHEKLSAAMFTFGVI